MNVGELKAFLADIPDERDVCVVRRSWEEFGLGVAGTARGRVLLFEEEAAPVDVAKHCAEQEAALRPTHGRLVAAVVRQWLETRALSDAQRAVLREEPRFSWGGVHPAPLEDLLDGKILPEGGIPLDVVLRMLISELEAPISRWSP